MKIDQGKVNSNLDYGCDRGNDEQWLVWEEFLKLNSGAIS